MRSSLTFAIAGLLMAVILFLDLLHPLDGPASQEDVREDCDLSDFVEG